MKFNKCKIKPFKGRMVEIEYLPKVRGNQRENKLTGEITADGSDNIFFKVNKSRPEISLSYDQIVNIKEPEKDNYKPKT